MSLLAVYRLIFAVEWISDRVPDGIIGLVIVLGYLFLSGVIAIGLIIKIARKAEIVEQEIKSYKLASNKNFKSFRKK